MQRKVNHNNILISSIISFIIILIFIYPNVSKYYINDYHFNIFLNICDKIQNNIYSFITFENSNGYPYEIFNKCLFYYPIAFLTLLNINNKLIFEIFICSIFLFNNICSSYIFSKLYGKNKINFYVIFCSLIYTFNAINLIYFNSCQIELLTSSIFVLFIFAGIYLLLKEKENWYYLTIGFTGLLYTNWQVLIIIILFLIIIYTINIKLLIKEPYNLFITFKAILYSLLLSSIQILPFFEQIKESNVKFSAINELITTNYFPMSIITLFLILTIGILVNKSKEFNINWNFIFLIIIFSLFYLLIYHSDFKFTNTFLLQILNNKLVVINIIFILLLISLYNFTNGHKYYNLLPKFIIFIILIISINILNIDFVNTSNVNYYFTTNTNENNILFENNSFIIHNENGEEIIIVPITFYKGYVAETYGHELEITCTANNLIQINTENNKEIKLYYRKTKIQDYSIFITIFSLLILLVSITKEEKHINKTEFSAYANKMLNANNKE